MLKKMNPNAMMLLACILWGMSPTITKLANIGTSYFNFIALRFGIGTIFLGIIYIKKIRMLSFEIVLKGLISAILLFSAFTCETIAVSFTSPLKVGFFISLDTIFIPIIYCIYKRQLLKTKEIICFLIAVFGIILINFNGIDLIIGKGEVIAICSAIFYAAYLVYVAQASSSLSTEIFSISILFFVTIFSMLSNIIFENGFTIIPSNNSALIAILISGLFCTTLAYLLQISAQKKISVINTGILYASTPIFSSIASKIVFNDEITIFIILGALLVISSLLILSFNFKKK